MAYILTLNYIKTYNEGKVVYICKTNHVKKYTFVSSYVRVRAFCSDLCQAMVSNKTRRTKREKLDIYLFDNLS